MKTQVVIVQGVECLTLVPENDTDKQCLYILKCNLESHAQFVKTVPEPPKPSVA